MNKCRMVAARLTKELKPLDGGLLERHPMTRRGILYTAREPYRFNLPVSISASIFQSPMNDQSGWVKVAGRFFSTKKCAAQANA